MRRCPLSAVFAVLLLAGCADPATVQGAGPDELLKLRAGPGLGYKIIMGLPDGTGLNRHGCVTEVGQLWCEVSLADAPQTRGYVSADYLTGQ